MTYLKNAPKNASKNASKNAPKNASKNPPKNALRRGALLGAALFFSMSLGACDAPKTIGDETTTDGACTPGEEAPADDGCNTCTCQGDGSWACTEIACATSSSGSSGGGACTPGEEMLDIDECGNYCTCSEDGEWACSNLGCTSQGCLPGESKPADDGCNQCTCDEDGVWGCTEISCEPCEEGATKPALDGCNTCECTADGEWACTEEGCDAKPIDLCDGGPGDDPVTITGGAIEGDVLTLEVSYGGGCEEHGFGGCWDGNFDLSEPPGAGLTLWHDANGDGCEALLYDSVALSLVPMRLAAEGGDPQASGTINVNVEGYGETFVYSY